MLLKSMHRITNRVVVFASLRFAKPMNKNPLDPSEEPTERTVDAIELIDYHEDGIEP